MEMPPILNEEQRKVFADRVDKVTSFLESEDGADAVELLVNTFAAFADEVIEGGQEQAPDEYHEKD